MVTTMCETKCCPGEVAHPVVVLLLLVLAAVLVFVVNAIWPAIVLGVHVAVISAAVLAVAGLTVASVRIIRASPAARRNMPRAVLAKARWRWLTRNLGLAYTDAYGRRKMRNGLNPAKGVIKQDRIEAPQKGHVRYPRARFRATEHGVTARVRVIPHAGKLEFERAAQHIADQWRCQRVQISQPKSGRLIVRGLVTDPLAEPYSAESVLPGLRGNPWSPFLGFDEWGIARHAPLSGIPGVLIAGNPGMGKTSAALWLLDQLAGSDAVQLAVIDGKDGGDFTAWRDRAWLSCGDELADAVAVLEDVHAEMRRRLKVLSSYSGPRNRWHCGPTADWPLIVTLIDEASTFFDLDAARGDKDREAQVRACRSLAGQLIKKGRSPLHVTILLSQRTTTDNTPSSLRDLCGLAMAFGVSTRATAVAALGDAIRDYPAFDPTLIRDPGICTVTLPSAGNDPYVRLRCPEVTQEAAEARAAETAHLRRDPREGLPELVPDTIAELVPNG
jgi:DNA segregation ATPase FtsK/SpoIIIE, S-DNA-T family